jgi:hypothetical protein
MHAQKYWYTGTSEDLQMEAAFFRMNGMQDIDFPLCAALDLPEKAKVCFVTTTSFHKVKSAARSRIGYAQCLLHLRNYSQLVFRMLRVLPAQSAIPALKVG